MGTKLPRKLEQKMSVVGEQIKLARLRRNLSVAQVAERATCSPLTVSRIEKGAPTVAVDILVNGADPATTPIETLERGIVTVNTETAEALGLDYSMFKDMCSEVIETVTAEEFE